MKTIPAKQVVIVVGFAGSGKSSVCRYLADQGFVLFRPSDVTRAFAASIGHPLHSRQDYIEVHALMNELQPTAIIDPIVSSSASKLCIDGLRSPFLLNQLRQQVPNTIVIALRCPAEERFRRVQSDDARTGTHRAPGTLAGFLADEQPDYTNQDSNLPNMNTMMTQADITLDASQDIATLQQQLDVALANRYET